VCIPDRGSLRGVSVLSAASNLPDHIRQRQASRADFLLRKQGIKPRVETLAPPSPGQGTIVFVLAEYAHMRAGFTSWGRIRKPAERVAEEACRSFIRYHKRRQPIDPHLADQLLLPLSLADGPSRYRVSSVTRHLLTNAWLVQQFLDAQIEIDGQEREPGEVAIHRAISGGT
jgi:RNA 3'-terminal phosphate cyclase (ATP)